MRRDGHRGFLLVESLVGFALFSIFIAAVGASFLVSSQSRIRASDRLRGALLAETSLEGVRSIRDRAFGELTAGDHGVRVGSGALGIRSIFDGIEVQTVGGYVMRVTLSQLTGSWLQVGARATWNHGASRSGSTVLSVELTDWHARWQPGNWAAPSVEGEYRDSGMPHFNTVLRSGDYVFITSEKSGGGRGLYIFDIRNPTSPVRVAASLDLGWAAYDLALRGATLFVATEDPGAELQAFNVSSPSTLSLGDRLASYDVPGSGRARSLAREESTLFLGATEHPVQEEFYAFDISQSSSMTLRSARQVEGSINDIAIRRQRTAYLASSEDIAELRIGDVSNPSRPVFPSGSGYNLTDVQDGLAIGLSGTAALIGRALGAAIEELVLFDIARAAVPSPPPGPWHYEVGGAVTALGVSPGWRYGFLATDAPGKQLEVVDLWRLQGGNPARASTLSVDTGIGRGLLYDPWKDRVYLVTDRGFHIVRPSL